ncbi:hypothetical protein [Gordonibacter massiliensis (ex Traore et al. 2017)]|uniref:hypothetical protein n=1 Tax=Gordonibacter massiliensis (ex Traore et al. 2017) TaxID=1841863 RepID=UPI001C8C7378|nr:hypothetical protein [Gordonibacter massiliensis (ex Traore et al. 2017)]MBX9035111.1 hypothetical protein [Gordonibacter massiliensis (ex Traore et al. 2017)]
MKKIAAVSTAFMLALCMSSVAFADGGSISGSGESQSIDVTAKYDDTTTTPTVYSVDVSWESMQFVYSESGSKIWNPLTHAYEDNVVSRWLKDKAAITVTNHSNVDVETAFSYVPERGVGVSGSFDVTGERLAAGVVGEYGSAPSVVSTLTISGKPSDVVTANGTKVGAVTVSIL